MTGHFVLFYNLGSKPAINLYLFKILTMENGPTNYTIENEYNWWCQNNNSSFKKIENKIYKF